jgi:chloramphenicol-sensitive protein RarD
MPPGRWFGFALIWLALAVFTADALWRARRSAQVAQATSQESVRIPDAGPS